MLPQRHYPVVGLAVVCLALCLPLVVKADAAPPQAPPGSSVATHDFETHVQMVSEEVTIDVQTYHGPTLVLYDDENTQEMSGDIVFSNAVLSEGDLVGHVTASFTMQNQGDAPESFEVWFPIGANDGYFNIVTVANFQAWVNGNPVETGRRETEGEFGDTLPWAAWPVDFPVGEPVQLAVAYDLPATFEFQRYRFDYVLETGSGWWDVIGTGTFTFRLPYEITGENASLRTNNLGEIPIDSLAVSGDEMRWTFSNLEPDRGDNIELRVISPSVWEEILAARAGVEASPDSAEAHLRLAHALTAAMGFKYGIASGEAFVPEAVRAYEEAIALAPDDVEVYIAYIEFLGMMAEPAGPLPDRLEPTLRQALAIAPEDERLLEWKAIVEDRVGFWATPTVTPAATPTHTPTAPPEETPSPTATLTPAQTAPTPAGEEVVDTPAPLTQRSIGVSMGAVVLCAGLALAVLIVAVVVVVVAAVLRRQKGDDDSTPG
jgi:hypothetical protein